MNGAAIKIDNRCQTSMHNVYAIGDQRRTDARAPGHGPGRDGRRNHQRQGREFNPTAIAAVCFTDPEVVVVGQTPDEARLPGWTASFPASRSPPMAGR
jgi:dihydrolipoamide dehydrogenase